MVTGWVGYVSKPQAIRGKEKKKMNKRKHTNFEANSSCDGATSKNSNASAESMARRSTQSHPPVVLAGGHGDGGNLRTVTPLSEEGHDEGLDPGGAEEEREEVSEALEETGYGGAVAGARGAAGGRRRRRTGRGREAVLRARLTTAVTASTTMAVAETHLESVGGDGGKVIGAAAVTTRTHERGFFFLFGQLALHLVQFFGDALVRVHGEPFAEEADAEDEEETGGSEGGKARRDEGGDGVAQDGGEDGHDEEGAEGGGEDDHAVVLHSHEGGYEEGLVANLGDEDHGHGEDERVEWTNDALIILVAARPDRDVRFRHTEIVFIGRVGNGKGFLVGGFGEMVGFLKRRQIERAQHFRQPSGQRR